MVLQGKPMRNRYEQVELYSAEEYGRRLALVREEMERAGVDILLIADPTGEAYDHWLTGRELLEYVVVPKTGKFYGILLNELDESGFADSFEAADFSRYVHQSSFETQARDVVFLNSLSQQGIARLIRTCGGPRIGIVNQNCLCYDLARALERELPNLEFVDLRRAISVRKTVKSEEELDCVKMASVVQGQMMQALRHMLRPGRSMKEIRTEVRDQTVAMGAGGFLHCMLIWLGPEDVPSGDIDPSAEDRIIQKGDRFFALYESNAWGGHCTAMGRVFILGKASEEYKAAVEFAADNNRYAASLLKPGNTLKQIRSMTESRAAMLGHTMKRMCWIHGLSTATYGEGFYMNEASDEWPLTNGAMVHCHPVSTRYMPWAGPGAWEEAWELNTYVVTPEGGRPVVQYPLGLTEIDVD